MKKNAYTIIEVLLGVFILFLIFGLLALFQKNVFSLNSILKSGINSQNEGRNTLKKITSEIRSISTASNGSYPIFSANDNVFIFYSDINGNGYKERVRYFLDGNTFKKGIIEPSGQPLIYNEGDEVVNSLISDIANGSVPIFTYYDKNYNGESDPLTQPVDVLDVRHIKITFIIDGNGPNPPKAITLESQASIRNLKDNF